DPEGHRTQTKEVTGDVLWQSGNQEDHETENGPLGFDDEAQLAPDVGAHQSLNIVGAEPPPGGEGRDRSHSQSNRRIEKPHPFAEQVATKDARHLAWDRGNDDLQRLEANENERSEDAPLSKRVLEEALVYVESN